MELCTPYRYEISMLFGILREMKRSGFKQKAYKPLKRSSLRKKSKSDIRKVQDLIWIECRRIVREQFGNKDGTIDCYTCPAKNIQGSNCQLGHMIPKASLGAFLKYDIRLLRYQCFRCNITLGGNGAVFYKRMLEEQGAVYMSRLLEDRTKTVKASDFYSTLLSEYKRT